jgi:hypothetical protein
VIDKQVHENFPFDFIVVIDRRVRVRVSACARTGVVPAGPTAVSTRRMKRLMTLLAVR